MSKAAVVRDYAVSVLWPDGHHYFEPEFFDDLTDARDREKHLASLYAGRVKAQQIKQKSVPTIHVWARQPSYKTLTVSRAPRRVSSKSRNLGEVK
jgi:predicted heme/steroid binding protein